MDSWSTAFEDRSAVQVMDGKDRAERAECAAQLLDRKGERERVDAAPAELPRNAVAEASELPELLEELR
jgi:hypothetical protein